MIVLQGAKERVDQLYFTPWGNTLVAPLGKRIQVWEDILASRLPSDFDVERAHSVQFIPNRALMIFDGPRVSIRDATGREREAIRFEEPVPEAADAAVSPDGRLLVFTQSKFMDFDGGRLVCRALEEPSTDLWSVPGDYRYPRRAMFLPGGGRFVSMEWWNGDTGFEHGSAWMTRETGTGRVVSEAREQGRGYTHLVQSPDLSLFVGLYKTRISVFRIDALGAAVAAIKNDSKMDFTGVAFHPSGRILAATSNDNTVKFYETTTWGRVGGFDWEVGRLRSVAFNADGSLAAAGADKGQIVVWDVDF